MNSLHSVARKARDYNRKVAELCCIMIEELRQDLTPRKLQIVQDGIRLGLDAVEVDLRVLAARKKRRSAAIHRRCSRKRELLRIRSEHDRLLKLHEALLQEQRGIFLQAGDSCAWIVLRADPRLIHPLFSSSATHYLPEGVGMYGVARLREQINETNVFLAVETDLTRCLGVGDLVVVRRDGRWIRPLVL